MAELYFDYSGNTLRPYWAGVTAQTSYSTCGISTSLDLSNTNSEIIEENYSSSNFVSLKLSGTTATTYYEMDNFHSLSKGCYVLRGYFQYGTGVYAGAGIAAAWVGQPSATVSYSADSKTLSISLGSFGTLINISSIICTFGYVGSDNVWNSLGSKTIASNNATSTNSFSFNMSSVDEGDYSIRMYVSYEATNGTQYKAQIFDVSSSNVWISNKTNILGSITISTITKPDPPAITYFYQCSQATAGINSIHIICEKYTNTSTKTYKYLFGLYSANGSSITSSSWIDENEYTFKNIDTDQEVYAYAQATLIVDGNWYNSSTGESARLRMLPELGEPTISVSGLSVNVTLPILKVTNISKSNVKYYAYIKNTSSGSVIVSEQVVSEGYTLHLDAIKNNNYTFGWYAKDVGTLGGSLANQYRIYGITPEYTYNFIGQDGWTWNPDNDGSKNTFSTAGYEGATANELYKAYIAITSQGSTKDFARHIWNDICQKAGEVKSKSATEIAAAKMDLENPDYLTAYKFNLVAGWLGYTPKDASGATVTITKGSRMLGRYFTELTDLIK